ARPFALRWAGRFFPLPPALASSNNQVWIGRVFPDAASPPRGTNMSQLKHVARKRTSLRVESLEDRWLPSAAGLLPPGLSVAPGLALALGVARASANSDASRGGDALSPTPNSHASATGQAHAGGSETAVSVRAQIQAGVLPPNPKAGIPGGGGSGGSG